MTDPLWTPGKRRAAQTTIWQLFSAWMSSRTGKRSATMTSCTVSRRLIPREFWSALWDFAGVVGDKGAPPFLADADKMPGARFFPDARLNFAENLLRQRRRRARRWCSGARTRSSGG